MSQKRIQSEIPAPKKASEVLTEYVNPLLTSAGPAIPAEELNHLLTVPVLAFGDSPCSKDAPSFKLNLSELKMEGILIYEYTAHRTIYSVG